MSSCAKNLPLHSPHPPAPGLGAIKRGASLIARALSGRLIDFLPPEVDPKILAYCDALHPRCSRRQLLDQDGGGRNGRLGRGHD